MKRFAGIFVITTIVAFLCTIAMAEEAAISIAAPQDIGKQACPTPIWKEMKIFWKGTVDERSSTSLGMQTKKGKDPISVVSDRPLKQIIDDGMKNMLTACGAKLLDAKKDDAFVLQASIKDFSADVQKKTFTGKSNAESSMVYMVEKGSYSRKVTINMEADSKGLRQGKLKQLEKELNKLLADTLLAAIKSNDFVEMFK